MYLFHNLLLGLLYTYIPGENTYKIFTFISWLVWAIGHQPQSGAKHSCFTFYGPKNSPNLSWTVSFYRSVL